jgi:enediyne biosynthesis protein E4
VYPQVDQYPIDMSFAEPKLVHHNLGNGKFADVTAQLGSALTSPWSGRGAAFADFDNDGDVDVAVNNLGTRPSLFLNEGGNRSGNWLLIELVSKAGNRGATGARVTVETEQTRQMQEVTAGNSYQSSNDWRLHFGLGSNSAAKSVVIRWPDKQLQRFDSVAANRRYFLKQGGQLAVTEPRRD